MPRKAEYTDEKASAGRKNSRVVALSGEVNADFIGRYSKRLSPIMTAATVSPDTSAAAVSARSRLSSPLNRYRAVSLLTISGMPLVVAVSSTKKNDNAT